MRLRDRSRWVAGNHFELLENGEAFFPAVFDAIRAAEREVIVETFILFEDKVGNELRSVLVDAARRGVSVDLLVDGFGCSELTPDFIATLTDAGVRLRVFDPGKPWFGIRTNVLRRMHRKIVVVDACRAFVGGINYSADHLADFGPEAKQDYAVAVRGPIVAEIHRFARSDVTPSGRRRWFRRHAAPVPAAAQAEAGSAHALFVTRDNREHRTAIERHYRVAIRSARERVFIANAYFFPGYRLLRDMRRAARRGVDVRLILQGEPDMAIVKTAAEMLYHHLLRAGVRVYEYCERPLHGKVALTDGEWSTVGSSNLDPLSLALNLEANVVIRDRTFNATLAERLEHLIEHSCKEIVREQLPAVGMWYRVRSAFVFLVLRSFSAWAGWLPVHEPRIDEPRPARAPAVSAAPADSGRAGVGGAAGT
jgi:cardiolipin synthase